MRKNVENECCFKKTVKYDPNSLFSSSTLVIIVKYFSIIIFFSFELFLCADSLFSLSESSIHPNDCVKMPGIFCPYYVAIFFGVKWFFTNNKSFSLSLSRSPFLVISK